MIEWVLIVWISLSSNSPSAEIAWFKEELSCEQVAKRLFMFTDPVRWECQHIRSNPDE